MNLDTIFFMNMVAPIAEKLAGTELSSSYGTPAFKVKKKMYARLREDGTTLVVYTNEREKWMKKSGKFVTTWRWLRDKEPSDYKRAFIKLAKKIGARFSSRGDGPH